MNAIARIGPGPLLFIAIWLFFMVAGQTRLFRDPGTQWHTIVGERILHEGFTTDEPFSFTKAHSRWIPHQWLGETAMALAHRVAGFDTFLLVTAAALAGLFTFLSLRLMATGLNPAVAGMVIVILIATAATHIHIRPMLLTLFALTITVAMLSDVEAGTRKLTSLYCLIPLYFVWSNVHGGMLGGLASLILVTFGWLVSKYLPGSSPIKAPRDDLRMGIIIIACAATAIVTPYGTGIAKVWWEILQQSRISELIEEHQPLNISLPTSWPLLVLAVLYFATLAGTLHRLPEATWLLPIFWLWQSFAHVRHSPLFAVTAFLAITAIWPQTRWARWLAVKRPDVYDPSKTNVKSPRWAWLLPGSLVLLTFTLQLAGVKVPVIGSGWAGLDPKLWPVDLIDDLKQHEPHDTPFNHIFNECGYGGFLIYHTPGYKVFVDDRAELYGEKFLEEYVLGSNEVTLEILSDLQRWNGVFYYALVKNDEPVDQLLRTRPGWRLIRRGSVASFYARAE